MYITIDAVLLHMGLARIYALFEVKLFNLKINWGKVINIKNVSEVYAYINRKVIFKIAQSKLF